MRVKEQCFHEPCEAIESLHITRTVLPEGPEAGPHFGEAEQEQLR